MSLTSDKRQPMSKRLVCSELLQLAVSSKQSRELLQPATARARSRERARVRVRSNFDDCNKPNVYSTIFCIGSGQGSPAC
jgi:hypothetical protein